MNSEEKDILAQNLIDRKVESFSALKTLRRESISSSLVALTIFAAAMAGLGLGDPTDMSATVKVWALLTFTTIGAAVFVAMLQYKALIRWEAFTTNVCEEELNNLRGSVYDSSLFADAFALVEKKLNPGVENIAVDKNRKSTLFFYKAYDVLIFLTILFSLATFINRLWT